MPKFCLLNIYCYQNKKLAPQLEQFKKVIFLGPTLGDFWEGRPQKFLETNLCTRAKNMSKQISGIHVTAKIFAIQKAFFFNSLLFFSACKFLIYFLKSPWSNPGLEISISYQQSMLHPLLFCYRLSQMLCFQFFLSIIAFFVLFAFMLSISRIFKLCFCSC